MFSRSKNDGSFGFCQKCPTNANCCTRVQRGGQIDCAIVFSEEAEIIEQHMGIKREVFLSPEQKSDGSPFDRLRTKENGGCFFNRRGQCQIYRVRPLDCRFFPFDIIEDEAGELRWVLYTKLCPVRLDYQTAFEELRSSFNLSEDFAWTYAEAQAPGMEGNNYIELDRVFGDVST